MKVKALSLNKPMSRIILAGAFVLVFFFGVSASCAQQQTKPMVRTLGPDFPNSAIYIGNSFFYFNNSMHSYVSGLIRAADPQRRPAWASSSVTISGSGIDWHDVESYFRPKAIGSYSFDDQNNIIFNNREKLFDVAILMDCSQCPIHPTLKSVFAEFTKKSSEIVRAKGTKPVFFMSWAYADKPEMTAELAEAYTLAGNANSALVIPAGLAFAQSVAKRPNLNLYAPDKRHPSVAGTYLAANVIYAALTGRSPVGNSFRAGIDADNAAFLQNVAWETVQQYYGE